MTDVQSGTHGIQVRDVSKTYRTGTNAALDRVSIDIASGEFLTLLGPSGSGKTTLLSIIAGFTIADTGQVLIDGQDVSVLKPHRRNLGVVFQNYALFPHMTVLENIAYPLKQRRVPKEALRERVSKALELVRLSAFESRYPRQLSGGQQQRVALARALVYEPRALLLDEPLGALDKGLRTGMQREIARIHHDLGMTFIFVTHDQEEAMSLSDRIAVLNGGRIVQVGTPEELYARPTSLFVANFFGETNVFAGSRDASGSVLESATGRLTLGDAAAGPADGDTVIVRPEHVRLSERAPEARGGANAVECELLALSYAGSYYNARVRYDDGSEGTVRCAVGDAAGITPGERYVAEWSLTDQIVVRSGE